MTLRQALVRILVTVAGLLAPVLGAVVIHYSIRKTHPRTSRFANLMSLAGFAFWGTSFARDWLDDRLVAGILGALGMIATDLSIRLARTIPHEPEPVTLSSPAPPNEELTPTATASSLVE